MKKILSLVLILIMVLTIAGCGKQELGTTAQMLNYDGNNYYVCGHGEEEILNKYDIQELSKESMGDFICYLELSNNEQDFVVSNDETDIELHEYKSLSLNDEDNDMRDVYIIAYNNKENTEYLAAIPQLDIAD